MKITVLIVVATLGLSGCGAIGGLTSGVSSPFSGGGIRGASDQIEGVRFRTRVSATSDDRRGFTTVTQGAARNPNAAAEAGRVRAVEYCLRGFGGSEIIWTVGPEEQMQLDEGGALVLAGACVAR